MSLEMQTRVCALLLMFVAAIYGAGGGEGDPFSVRRGLERVFPRAGNEGAPLAPGGSGDSWNVRPVGRLAFGPCYAVATSGNQVYFGNGCYVEIADIFNPSKAVRRGKLELPAQVRGLAAAGNYVYVADGESGLRIIDVSNPLSPREVGSFDTPGIALGVAVSGGYAYGADGDAGLRVIDVSNPASPREVGSSDTPGEARSVAVSGDCAYVADGEAGLRVIGVSNPSSPRELGYFDTGECL